MANLSEQLQAKTEAFKLAVAEAKTANAEKLENKLAEVKKLKRLPRKLSWKKK